MTSLKSSHLSVKNDQSIDKKLCVGLVKHAVLSGAFLNDVHFYDRKARCRCQTRQPQRIHVWPSVVMSWCEANEWQQLFPESSPKARYQHTAVWSVATDGMYIYGGWGESSLAAKFTAGHFLSLF